MSGKNKEKGTVKDKQDINIDYEDIDVADIMDQIKKKIATQPQQPEQEESPREAPTSAAPEPFQGKPAEAPGAKSKVKKILLKIMRPFSPLLKLLILPVYSELRETVMSLDQTNRRLDYLHHRMEQDLLKLGETMNAALNETTNKLQVSINDVAVGMNESTAKTNRIINDTNKNLDKTSKRIDNVNDRIALVSQDAQKRLDLAFDDLNRTMEFTKLLHSLSHNLVVEMTKMKIEEETLKVKTRIMEKDFEFLGRREKALEERVFK